ncbi:MAG: MarR family transcriptional regulator [Acetobacteraceae bacterium]|nr:MarR family transcriptional regulator [Acetobacteraceae bacterium]MDW8397076.1 MarR family transcriptional regulator [Acetobacteraceae bacterium]
MSRRAAQGVDLHAFLPTLVVDLANALWRTGAAFYRRRFGVGMVEVRLLLALGREARPLTAAAIAEAVRLDKAAVSRGLKALAAAGHVALSPDPRGGRRVAVLLTEQGRRLAGEIARCSLERQAAILKGLSPEEAAGLSAGLRRLLSNVDRLHAADRAAGN